MKEGFVHEKVKRKRQRKMDKNNERHAIQKRPDLLLLHVSLTPTSSHTSAGDFITVWRENIFLFSFFAFLSTNKSYSIVSANSIVLECVHPFVQRLKKIMEKAETKTKKKDF
eukprot:gene3911-2779_t